jgi:hypothetical protein
LNDAVSEQERRHSFKVEKIFDNAGKDIGRKVAKV